MPQVVRRLIADAVPAGARCTWPARALRTLLACLAVLAAAIALDAGTASPALAQQQAETKRAPLAVTANPPSAQRTAAQPQASEGVLAGAWTWLGVQQRRLTGEMTTAVRRLKAEGSLGAGVILAVVSFIYGVLHAAGPGHGKFVISSYALANERTVRRGILLAFMSSAFQAVSAVVLVGVLALVVRATSVQMKLTEQWLEVASWALVAALGAAMLYARVRPLLAAVPATAHGHHHDHAHAGHAHAPHAGCAHDHHHHHHAHTAACGHDHGHDHAACCGHAHLAAPAALQGAWSWREALAISLSIGIRPCTGAILVLLFALNLGLWWAGVFATFAMALGTAITVSSLAALAVGARDLAARIAGRESPLAGRIQTLAGVTGAALVFLLGASFLIQSLVNPVPL